MEGNDACTRLERAYWGRAKRTADPAEGEILRRLNENGVRGIPTVVCHGVVGGQVSRVLDCWMNLGETDPT